VGGHIPVRFPSEEDPGYAGWHFESATLPAPAFEREIVPATGAAGDVYLCHPFLVHRASWPHRGRTPRIIAQPSVWLKEPYALVDPNSALPVERAILRGLDRAS
jgi:hypothetical protein